ncbi:hypothetical protein VTJ04DRAFT_4580 [Mycothermus thermophilus]|uniref:uncharacterized protein n=1 Tax=Humicola insolens TaxID=85995 RepID=UPI0037436573
MSTVQVTKADGAHRTPTSIRRPLVASSARGPHAFPQTCGPDSAKQPRVPADPDLSMSPWWGGGAGSSKRTLLVSLVLVMASSGLLRIRPGRVPLAVSKEGSPGS